MLTDFLPVIDVTLKGVVLLILGFISQQMLCRASAAQRSLAWLIVFAVLAVLPASILIKPRWIIQVDETPTQTLPYIAPIPLADAAPIASTPPVSTIPWWQTLKLADWAFFTWATGGSLVLAFRLLGSWQLQRLHKASFVCKDRRILLHVDKLTLELSAPSTVTIYQSALTRVPLTWGVYHSVILLPENAGDWSDTVLDATLRHELGHICHRDALSRWLGTFVCAMWWPLPMIWIAFRSWRLEQEKACDDIVLNAGTEPSNYASQLLSLARSLAPQPSAALAMARPSSLEIRLLSVMEAGRNRNPMGRKNFVLSSVSALVLAGLCLLAQLQAEQSPSPTPIIQIRALILEGPQGTLRELLETPLAHPGITSLSSEAVKKLCNDISLKKSVDTLSSPSLVTKSGQAATIEVGNETPRVEGAKETYFAGIKVSVKAVLIHNDLDLSTKVTISAPLDPATYRPSFAESVVEGNNTLKVGDGAVVTGLKSGKPNMEVFCILTTASPSKEEAVHSAVPPIPDIKSKAHGLILPKLVLPDATIVEAVDAILSLSRKIDPTGEGINIVLRTHEPMSKITLNLRDVPVDEALKYCAALSNLTLSYQSTAAILHPPDQNPVNAPVNSPVFTRAKKIVLPNLIFPNASVKDIIDFIVVKSRELDSEHQGVNVVYVPGPVPSPLIQLKLKNISAADALSYIATVANLDIATDKASVILSPKSQAAAGVDH